MSGTTPAEGMTWDLGALRDGVRAAFGPDQRRLVSQSIQSVSDRRKFSAYHYQEAMRIIAAKVDGRPGDELLPIMMGADDNDTGSFEDARFTAYANIVACMHSMRSVADNLVHLVYYATGMNRDAATSTFWLLLPTDPRQTPTALPTTRRANHAPVDLREARPWSGLHRYRRWPCHVGTWPPPGTSRPTGLRQSVGGLEFRRAAHDPQHMEAPTDCRQTARWPCC